MTLSVPRPILQDDNVVAFDCGDSTLNDYLAWRAWTNHVSGASRCFVTTDGERVVGYYALAASSILHRDAPGNVRRNMPDPVPVILLSRLGVNLRHQGQGVGASLLQDAVVRVTAAARSIGIRALLVHVVDEKARSFYAHHGFVASPTNQMHLLLRLKDVEALLEQ
jgi:GNAT superfamily N-acetyltransferase